MDLQERRCDCEFCMDARRPVRVFWFCMDVGIDEGFPTMAGIGDAVYVSCRGQGSSVLGLCGWVVAMSGADLSKGFFEGQELGSSEVEVRQAGAGGMSPTSGSASACRFLWRGFRQRGRGRAGGSRYGGEQLGSNRCPP